MKIKIPLILLIVTIAFLTCKALNPDDPRNDATNPRLKISLSGPNNYAELGLTAKDHHYYFGAEHREGDLLTVNCATTYLRKRADYTLYVTMNEDMGCDSLKIYYNPQIIKISSIEYNLSPEPLEPHQSTELKTTYVTERIVGDCDGQRPCAVGGYAYRRIPSGQEVVDLLVFTSPITNPKLGMLVAINFRTDIGNFNEMKNSFLITSQNFSTFERSKRSSVHLKDFVISSTGFNSYNDCCRNIFGTINDQKQPFKNCNRDVAECKTNLYRDCNYSPTPLRLGAGSYPTMPPGLVKSDELSSIKVPDLYVARLFEHINYEGRSLDFRGNTSCLRSSSLDDLVSSVIISKITAEIHSSCTVGSFQRMGLGRYTQSQLRVTEIKRVLVSRGYKVQLFRSADCSGTPEITLRSGATFTLPDCSSEGYHSLIILEDR